MGPCCISEAQEDLKVVQYDEQLLHRVIDPSTLLSNR
jgi:hypothetical protein